MEGHAPAAAPYAMVFLDQPRKFRPVVWGQIFHYENGHRHDPDAAAGQ
jgi:hypothetical protein